jgi:pilus assembly protein CpaE
MNAFPSRETTLRMVEVACEVYDHVIIDMPRWPMTWTKDIVLGADETLLISELSVPALKAARDWILDFDSDAVPGMSRVKTVLNRKQKSLFGSNVTIEQAEKAIQQRVFSAVHSDWASALAAVNLGQPVSMAKPNSTISKDVASLVQLLNDPKQTADQTRADKRVA